MMKPQSLLQRSLVSQKCTVGCPILDACLCGGVPCNSITELVAESGVGKTQFCLQLAVSAQLPPSLGGLSGASLYIHTEFPFPLRRLRQLSHSFRSSHATIFTHDPCDRIFVHAVQTAHQLLDVMPRIDSFISTSSTRFPVRLIVIDSIAALFRSEFDNTPSDMKKRSVLFFKISGKLKALAEKFRLAVVVTNQVVDLVDDQGINGMRSGNLRWLFTSGRRVSPALGLAWSHCVNSRFFLSRNEEVVGKVNDLGARDGVEGDDNLCRLTRRRLHVVFAPHLPETSCELVITREGVYGVDS